MASVPPAGPRLGRQLAASWKQAAAMRAGTARARRGAGNAASGAGTKQGLCRGVRLLVSRDRRRRSGAEEYVEHPADRPVALARRLFQPVAVEYGDAAPVYPDEPGLL